MYHLGSLLEGQNASRGVTNFVWLKKTRKTLRRLVCSRCLKGNADDAGNALSRGARKGTGIITRGL
jgi:hypothetical protein